MIHDYSYFYRRYIQIEEDFLEIIDYIEISNDFNDCCYQIGSSKMMDFCLKVGTEVETHFREILNSSRFDNVPNINNKRNNQNIRVYNEVLEPVYDFHNNEIRIKSINRNIRPFQGFESDTMEWFRIYSRDKHNKVELIRNWNLKHSIFALGCTLLLVINHPTRDNLPFGSHKISNRVFDLLRVQPKFATIIFHVST